MASYLRIGSILFAAALSMSSLGAPARAQSAEKALIEASKMMEQGIPVKAIEIIDAALSSGKLPPESAAKALLMRAQAQEKLGKLAFALADYNSALWMEGLAAGDKAQAEQGRDRISGKLGVAEPGKTAPAPVGRAKAGEDSAARTPKSASADTSVKSSPSEQRTGGIGSVFTGIFGASEAAPAPQRAKPAAAKPATAAKPAPAASTPEQAKSTQPRAETPVQVAVAQRASPAAATGDGSGKFGIQFAALHSEDGAIAEVERIAKKFGSELGGRSPSVKILATNDGGTLYKIVAEPYERGEATAICELLKTKNLSCMIVSR
jgi:hypothetical protein